MGPLAGIKVIELAAVGPVPFCAMLLSDMGAEVLRIDRMNASDSSFRTADFPGFDVLNRGRRSMAVDLKHERGAEAVLKLARRADVFIEGFRPGVAERLGIGPDECCAQNAKLIYARMTGWGQDGPLAHASGHDINYISLAGPLAAMGRPGSPPAPPLNLVGDFGGGALFLAFGIVAALLETAAAFVRREGAAMTARAPGARALLVAALVLTCAGRTAAQSPAPTEGTYVLKDFRFRSGESLPELRLHYRTLGAVQRDAQGIVRNAVLIMHGTGGSGGQFMRSEFAGELFGPGQLLDASRYFIVLPDGIGHGRSSKPSDGLRGRFPRYGYLDMIDAQHRLLTEGLGVNHLRLVMGTSMGGMHTWLWGGRYPTFMDALMPLASLPTQISGRNRVWRRIVIDAIRQDPAWRNGEYSTQPPGLRIAQQMLYLMSSNPVLRQQQMKTVAESDAVFDAAVEASVKTADANDVLYAIEASRDYDPGPHLANIRAPLLAINSADDLINPPELGILEREIARVPKGRAVVLPLSPETRGHGSHTVAPLWKAYLQELLAIR